MGIRRELSRVVRTVRSTSRISDSKLRNYSHRAKDGLIEVGLGALLFVAALITGIHNLHVFAILWGVTGAVKTLVAMFRRKIVLDEVQRLEGTKEVRPIVGDGLAEVVRLDKIWLQADPSAIIDQETFDSWSTANFRSFYGCYESSGVLSGYYSLLCLRSETMKSFIAGTIAESNFTGRDVLSPEEEVEVEDLYFFSTASYPAHNRALNKASYRLLRHAASRINYLHMHGCAKRLFATAATGEGLELLKFLKFEIVPCESRKDGHDLYVLDLEECNVLELFFAASKGGGYRKRALRSPGPKEPPDSPAEWPQED